MTSYGERIAESERPPLSVVVPSRDRPALTSWAATIAVPTLITGFYGMNIPFPGSGERIGVWTASALIAVLSARLYVLFRNKEWL